MHNPAPTQADPIQSNATPRRVLIVEDHDDSAESICTLLEMRGYQVAIAQDGLSALAKARTFSPQVVVCDIGLPGDIDGYEVGRRLRSDATLARCRLIALTGHGGEEDRRRAREAGFDSHLLKPVDFDKLALEIAKDS